MDIVRLYQDYGLRIAPEDHKHTRPGWINVECPFCTGNPGYHLGTTLDGAIFYCWRCGVKFPDQAISKLLHVSFSQAKRIIDEYAGISAKKKEVIIRIGARMHKLPSGCVPLLQSHAHYLEKRGFDPDQIKEEWNVVSTGPFSKLDGVDYSHRILAPVFWNHRQVTFQARDVTNKHPSKYLACMKERELIHHKHIIYLHKEWKGSTAICVEGITDVWRFGRASFATFGIEYKRQQVRLIASLFQRVPVCFDGGERQAQKQAKEMVRNLKARGVDSFLVTIEGDPGAMKQKDADYLVKQLIK